MRALVAFMGVAPLLAIVVSAALLTRVHERRLSHVQLLTVAEQAERKASGLWVALQQAHPMTMLQVGSLSADRQQLEVTGSGLAAPLQLPIADVLRQADETRQGAPAAIAILNRHHELIAGSQLAPALAEAANAPDLETREFDSDGRHLLEILSSHPSSPFVISVQRDLPRAWVSTPVVLYGLALTALLLGLALVATLVTLRSQHARPLSALLEAADLVSRPVRGPLPDALLGRGDEFGRLARAYDNLSSRLSDAERKLREKSAPESLAPVVPPSERLAHDLSTARDIQLGIVTRRLSRDPERRFDVAAYLEPAREVGGDLYLVEMLDENHLCFVVGDVSDKGIPAALFMAVTITLARAKLRFLRDPAVVLARLNDDLAIDNPQTMFVTLACGVLNVVTGELQIASAGHTLPVLIRNGESSWLYTEGGTAAGIQTGLEFQNHTTTLQPGDQIVLYTDGVTEAMNPRSDIYGDERLLKTVGGGTGAGPKTPRETLAVVRDSVKQFADSAPPSDDIAVVVVGYRTWAAV